MTLKANKNELKATKVKYRCHEACNKVNIGWVLIWFWCDFMLFWNIYLRRTLTSGMNPISLRWLLSSGSWNAIICEKTVRYSEEVKNKSIQASVLQPKTLLPRYTHGRTNTSLKAQSESKTKQFCCWSADSWASKTQQQTCPNVRLQKSFKCLWL